MNGDNRHNGQNPYGHAPENSAGSGFGIGGHFGGVRQNDNHRRVGYARGGPGNNPKPTPQELTDTAGRRSEMFGRM